MSSEVLKQAAAYVAPIAANGDVLVLAGSATARGATQLVDPTTDDEYWFEFEADGVDVYITIGDANVTAPGIASVAGASRAIKIPDGTSKQFLFARGRSHFDDIESAAAGYLRIYRASIKLESGWARRT